MGERLREVAELALRDRVVLLGEQPDVVGQAEQPLEQRAGLVGAPDACARLSASQNEQGRNAPSPGGQAVDRAVGSVS